MKNNLFKSVSFVLVFVILTSVFFVGCSKEDTKVETKTDSSQKEETKKDTTQQEEVKEELAKVSWYMRPTAQNDMQLVQDELNKIFIDKINTELEIKRIDPGSYQQKMSVIVSSGETFDLCHSAPRYGYYENVAKGAYLPLDEYFDTHAPKTYAQVPEEFWDAVKIKGKIYGVINYQIAARQYSFAVQKDMVEKYGFNIQSVKTLEDVEPILATLKENEGNDKIIFSMFKSGIWHGTLQHYYGIEQIGTRYSPGAIEEGSHTVINQYNTDEYKQYLNLMYDFYKKDYIEKNAATSTNFREICGLGTTLTAINDVKPGDKASFEALMGGKEYERVMIDTPFVTTNNIAATMTSLSRTSKNPEKAMELLELVNTDKEVYNLLINGIEGKHYTKVGENRIEIIPDSGYAPNCGWMVGNQFNAYLLPSQTDNVWEQTIALNESADKSSILGFNFDPEPIKGEIAKCMSVYEEFGPGLETGTLDPEEYLPKFLEKLDAAGVDKIITEEQRQLDEWLAGK